MVTSMRTKRIALIIIVTILTVLILGMFQTSNATSGSLWLNIEMLRASGFGYKALEKNVWKIVESNSSGSTADYSQTIYCLKGGPGFAGAFEDPGDDSTSGDNQKITSRHYTQYFDMKDPDSIPSTYKRALPDTNSTEYKALVWLLENAFVHDPSWNGTEEQEQIDAFLAQYGIEWSYLTYDDIDVVQQLAIWHFTNDDQFDAGDNGNFELWINAYAGQDSSYSPLSDENGVGGENGWDRSEDAKTLYRELVDAALENAGDYQVTPSSQPYELADLNQTVENQGNNYVIGPFRINQVSGTNGTLQGTFTDGDGHTLNPTFQDEEGRSFSNLQDTIGQNFYIVIPNTTNIERITFTISGSYYDTKVTYWSVEGAPEADQPVAIVERTEEPYRDEEVFTHKEQPEEIFDLALRKFITSINGNSPTVSRVPQISSEELGELRDGTTTTADKIHPKNALTVSTGDSVVYTIRVYNEGNVDGIVTEITDYLPNGLTLKADSSKNTQYGWTTTDGRTVTTDHLAGQKIPAFNGTTLSYLDVQIECEVTATVQEENVNLKNVAEITGCTNGDGEDMTDRDSTPDNVDVPGYGNESQEDDDDFENLVILGKYFDLSLRKFITGVNDRELTDSSGRYLREPVVDITPLTSGSSTTAIYNHPKNPVTVAVGDEVIYTIRVYNEGQIDGYVYEITDYLPANLEFVNDEFNASYGWQISGDGRTVTTDITSPDTQYSASRDTIFADRIRYADSNESTNSDTSTNASVQADHVLLKAFDGENLDYIDVKIKCRVRDTAVPDEKLTNITEITEDRDSNKQEVTDRDSTENNVTLPSDETLPNYKDDEINRGDEYIPGQQDDDDFDKVVIQKFDLALRKFITGVNDQVITNREPVFRVENGEYVYNHTKDPVDVATGDIVIYTLRIYNEGDIAGYAEEVKDDIPDGLEFIPDNSTNINYRWVMYDVNGEVTENVSEAVTIRTDYLSKAQADATGRDNLIEPFDPTTMLEPDYKEVRIAFRVTEPNTSDRIIINTAEISEDADENGKPVDDIDSTPDNDTDGEDDIDIEKIKVKYFDLALRKFITGVNDQTVTDREPVFHNNNGEYTYEHTKDPVEVATGDTVIYTLRIYNEGTQAGYAEEVKDDIPDGLEFLPDNSINNEYRWVMYDASGNVTKNVEEAVSIRTDYLSKAQEDETGRDNLIDAFDPDTMTEPDYKEVRIAFRVVEPNTSDRVIINTAEISEDADEDGEPVDDIDSTPDNDEDGEDDIDKEQVELKYFDLALRKFITGVNDQDITNRVPVFSNNNGEYTYTHTKDPIEVSNGDTVIYTLRIYNEGTQAGYAEEVKDDLPEGLEFLPDNSINNEYRWVMYAANGEVTENVSEAVTIRTDYLSKAQEELTGRDNLIDAFDPDTMTQPDYKDLRIAFRVVEPNTSDRIIINTAEVSEDANENGEPVTDIDSTPDNDTDGEDDIDIEKVKVSYFDLALKKIITKVTMTLDGETTVEETGHTFEDNPEEVVKIELGNHKINDSTIKFTYQIRITNEGNKAGYAYEIKDYIPEGLEFVAEDNEDWVLSEDGRTVTTDQLADTLLEPGESATVEITLRWINGHDNLGVKTNWAEISEDSDDDIDSTPDNFEEGEDDIDDASVVLSIVTGVGGHYLGVITTVLVILGGGIVLIKKFVL